MSTQEVKGHLDPLVMAILEDGPLHGYGVIEQLRLRSDGLFDLAEGTVYPALHRLERTGTITSARRTVGGRDRRVYRLSRGGRASLAQRRSEWTQFSSAVATILGVQPA